MILNLNSEQGSGIPYAQGLQTDVNLIDPFL